MVYIHYPLGRAYFNDTSITNYGIVGGDSKFSIAMSRPNFYPRILFLLTLLLFLCSIPSYNGSVYGYNCNGFDNSCCSENDLGYRVALISILDYKQKSIFYNIRPGRRGEGKNRGETWLQLAAGSGSN